MEIISEVSKLGQANLWELLARTGRPMTKKEITEALDIAESWVDGSIRGLRMRRVLKVTKGENGTNLYELNEKGKREA